MTERKAVRLDRDLEEDRRQALEGGKPFAVWVFGQIAVRPAANCFHPSLADAEAHRDRIVASDTFMVAAAYIEEYRDGRWREVPASRRFGKLELDPAGD